MTGQGKRGPSPLTTTETLEAPSVTPGPDPQDPQRTLWKPIPPETEETDIYMSVGSMAGPATAPPMSPECTGREVDEINPYLLSGDQESESSESEEEEPVSPQRKKPKPKKRSPPRAGWWFWRQQPGNKYIAHAIPGAVMRSLLDRGFRVTVTHSPKEGYLATWSKPHRPWSEKPGTENSPISVGP